MHLKQDLKLYMRVNHTNTYVEFTNTPKTSFVFAIVTEHS